ncbi:MAG: hydrogenase maturation protease [Nitrospirota bacterium]
MKKTLIIGLGNPILRDDGVGIAVVRELKEQLPASDDLIIMELSVGGLRLMEAMVGYDRIILVDAVCTPDGQAGAVRCLALDDISMPLHTASAHDTTLKSALDAGRRMGLELPDDISIVAIEAADVTHFGTAMTRAVRDAVPLAVHSIIEMLGGKNLP